MSRDADITKSEEICKWENRKERQGGPHSQDIWGRKYIHGLQQLQGSELLLLSDSLGTK